MKRRAAVALVVALALLAVMQLPGSAQSTSDPAAAVQQLLDQRVAAMKRGDLAAFLATVDPKADKAFIDQQSVTFAGLRSLPFSEYSLRVRLDDSGDLSFGLDAAKKHGASQAFLPETVESSRLSDYDDRSATSQMWWTYVERNGKWYISAENDAEVLGLKSARDIWDFGALVTQKTPHFLVITSPGKAARAQAISVIAENAMTVFKSRWTQPWSEKIPLIIPQSPDVTSALLNTEHVEKFSAFVAYVPTRENGYATTAPRIYAQDENLSGASASRQIETLVHELTHAATSTLTGPFTPTWMQEGLAEYIRRAKPIEPIALSDGAAASLPSTADFGVSDSDKLGQAYTRALAANAYIGSTKGADAPIELFDAVGERKVTAGTPAFNLNQAFNKVLGQSVSDFESAWKASVHD